MGSLNKIRRSYWFNTGLGVVVLGVLIWFFGPMLALGQVHPFDSETARLIAIGALIVLWLVVNVLHIVNARRKDKKLVDNVVAAPDADATASAEEVALLSERLKEALDKLKKLPGGKRGRRRLYELPWYMFIGPPGAGKTTALVNSGLNFPLADASGPAALRGVGGTRNCEWWFTDQAVLIDTAGRYTTQDSQTAVDAAAWLGFLRLLKKNRRRQPLNGVLLAIGMPDLAALSETDRLAHATAMRKRMRELQDELGVRVPVYVLFTKADLIAGFVEFFDNLGREEREQVWGMTFKLDDPRAGKQDEGGAVAQFSAEFELLIARLNDQMLERVNQETDIHRRRLIYGFPQQIASMHSIAADFLTEIFRPSRLEARPLLRGAYFTSGTQDGTPIDRLLGVMAGQFGLQRQAVSAFSGAGRSYFLTRLLREVVFGEAALVSQDPKIERRTRWIYRSAWSGAALVLLCFTAGWTNSYIGNREMIDEAHGAVVHYNAQYAELAKRGPADTDLRAILPALATLRTMRGGYDQREADTPLTLTFGLYQGDKITAAAVEGYYRALNGLLLPRLISRLETQIAASLDKPDYLYEALKVYLILGRQGPIDHDHVNVWLSNDFNVAFAGDDDAEDREALLAHADAMLQRPLTAIPLNGPLVATVREILNREPLADYSYNRIMRSPRVTSLPEWTIADNGGAGSGKVFARRSGASVNTGLPGIFTWAGYHNTFLPLLPTVTQDISEDGWVLGRENKAGVAGTIAEVNKLRRDVAGLYYDQYVRVWDRLLNDIILKSFSNVADAVDQLGLISGPNSPLRTLLTSIDQQTQLSRAGAADGAQAAAEAKVAKIGQRAAGFGTLMARSGMSLTQNELASVLGEAFGGTPGGQAPVDPATRVDAHFRLFHNFVFGSKEKPAPMEAAIDKIGAIYQGMNQVANAPNQGQALIAMAGGATPAGGGAAGGGGGGATPAAAANQLQDLAKDLPSPVKSMLQTVAASTTASAGGGASRALQEAWRTKVLPLCDAAFLNRYPFVAGSPVDVPTDDFARLLGPGGLIDQFFNENLKNVVDVSASPWKWQGANNTQLGLQQGTLVQLENAAKIRDSLFGAGGQILIRFQLIPSALDAGVGQITLDIAGQPMTYNHGPAESAAFQWPNQGKTLVRVTMTPASGTGAAEGNGQVTEKDGPWALLRILDPPTKVLPSGQPDKFSLVFSSPAGTASFQLNASSVRNPFTLTALRAFRCPATL